MAMNLDDMRAEATEKVKDALLDVYGDKEPDEAEMEKLAAIIAEVAVAVVLHIQHNAETESGGEAIL